MYKQNQWEKNKNKKKGTFLSLKCKGGRNKNSQVLHIKYGNLIII